MKGNAQHTFIKTIVILMMFFVCLPCTAKREIKQIFGIPLSGLQQSEKPNQAAACFVFNQKLNSKTTVVSQQKRAKTSKLFSAFLVSENVAFIQNVFGISVAKNKATIPIYLLHEQYLI